MFVVSDTSKVDKFTYCLLEWNVSKTSTVYRKGNVPLRVLAIAGLCNYLETFARTAQHTVLTSRVCMFDVLAYR